jgi:pimeloyl-ACP methyl ester carboxylesterase
MATTGASGHREGRRKRWGGWLKGGLLLSGAVALPALAHHLIRRQAQAPQAPRWGRGRRYAGPYGEIVFQELGSGSPLVLLHSFGPGHDAEEWRAAAEILAERHCVFAPDLPGWARSAPPAGYHPEAYADAIADFLAGVVREPAVLVAAGLPAAYALEVASRHPERVRALALICPAGLENGADGRGGPGLLKKLLSFPLLGASALDLLTSRGALVGHLRRDVYAAPERVDAALVEHHYRSSHQSEARRALAAYLGGHLRPQAEALEGLTLPRDLPVWIAWGRSAADPAVACADLWLRQVPEAQLEVFEGVGCLPHAEIPATFCYAFGQFVAGLPD